MDPLSGPFSIILVVMVSTSSGAPKEYRDVYRTMAECQAALPAEVDKRGPLAKGYCFDLNLRYDKDKIYWTGPTYLYNRNTSNPLR
jgi:hypothetical protein